MYVLFVFCFVCLLIFFSQPIFVFSAACFFSQLIFGFPQPVTVKCLTLFLLSRCFGASHPGKEAECQAPTSAPATLARSASSAFPMSSPHRGVRAGLQGAGEEDGAEAAERPAPSRRQLPAGRDGWRPAQSQHEAGHSGGQRENKMRSRSYVARETDRQRLRQICGQINRDCDTSDRQTETGYRQRDKQRLRQREREREGERRGGRGRESGSKQERDRHRERATRERTDISRKRGRERNGQYEIYLHDKIIKDFK